MAIAVAIFQSGAKQWTDRHCNPQGPTARMNKNTYRATQKTQKSAYSMSASLQESGSIFIVCLHGIHHNSIKTNFTSEHVMPCK